MSSTLLFILLLSAVVAVVDSEAKSACKYIVVNILSVSLLSTFIVVYFFTVDRYLMVNKVVYIYRFVQKASHQLHGLLAFSDTDQIVNIRSLPHPPYVCNKSIY